MNRAHYQNVTFVLLRNGEPVAHISPAREKICTGRDLANAIGRHALSESEAEAWNRDLRVARKALKARADKWR